MRWECPVCKRTFNSRNQQHSCEIRSLEEHLHGKNKSVIELVHQILQTLSGFNNITVQPVKHAIIVSGRSSFMALKTRKDYVEIELVLDESIDQFPVYKIISYTSKKFAHFIRIDSPEDFDDSIKLLMQQAFLANIR